MSHSQPQVMDAWVITDVYGEIQSCSRPARDLLGMRRPGRYNLLQFFPRHSKALVFDIEVALTGWPAGRVLPSWRGAATRSVFRYTVSRRLDAEGLQLFWQLSSHLDEHLPRCA